jgi:hypothetical protein
MSKSLRGLKMPERKMATFAEAAKTNIEQAKAYHRHFWESSEILKEFLGVLLLRLVAGQAEPDGGQLFERLLRQLYAGGAV